MSESGHRAGVVALLGRPNAGKSTLLNRLLGWKLAIVTAKPQTTRSRLLGILTLPNAQVAFVDTPGLHESSKSLNVALNEIVESVADGCDLALLLVDPRCGWGEAEAELAARLRRQGTPLLLISSKGDLSGAADAGWPEPLPERLRVSGRTGAGVPELLERVLAMLPESPPLYPADELSDRPLRFLAAELVREAAFEVLEQELPYSLAVEVEEWDEKRPDLVRVRANLLLERASQKPIVIGRNGAVIKEIGTRARREIEKLVDRKVHLELWVKIEPKWSRHPKRLKTLGYS
jgi:GTP-binding protein Era